MSSKRPREDDPAAPAQKKARKGFKLGPQNLPDGVYKRKLDKIRRKLVDNAKVKKSYDKLKAREQREAAEDVTEEAANSARHPERQALIDEQAESHVPANQDLTENDSRSRPHRPKRSKPQPFQREQRLAVAQRKQHDEQREEMAAAQAEREKRIAERQRWRRTLNNARGDGRRRKLGKESTVLLEKVQRMMRQGG